jgi:hypothetical protein
MALGQVYLRMLGVVSANYYSIITISLFISVSGMSIEYEFTVQ